jgi:hypothetical protein
MLPNIRLLVVAVLAAIAGISCGLGLFATFRVNHEPLVRFSEGGPPLQLAFDNRTAAPEAAAPIAARLPLDSVGRAISAPVLIPPPPSVEESQAGGGPIAPQQDGDAAASADAASATPIASATPVNASERAAQDSDPIQGEAEAAAASEPKAIDVASNNPVAAAADEPAVEKNAHSITDDQQTPVTPSTARENKTVKTPIKAARAAAPVRRAAKVVRRRAPATVAAQPANQYAQANYQQSGQTTYQAYQWTDPNAQAVRRVVVKRHRVVKKPAPAAQSNLAGATAGAGGPQ